MSQVPAELKYAKSHEWARLLPDGRIEIGITDHAQQALGDLVFVEVEAEGIVTGGVPAWLAILGFGFVLAAVVPRGRLHADVLLHELVRGEVVHEVLRGDEAAFLVCVLEQNLVQPFDDGLHDLLKAEAHCLFLLVVGADVLSKLLVNFLDDSVQPVTHVRVSQLNFFQHLLRLFVQFLSRLDLHVQLVDLGVRRTSAFDFEVCLLVSVMHLKFVEFFDDLFVLAAEMVKLLFVFAYSIQQLRVRRLSREELLHDLLDVGEACLRADLLERLLDLGRAGHLLVHLRLKERAPELLRKEVFVHFQLV